MPCIRNLACLAFVTCGLVYALQLVKGVSCVLPHDKLHTSSVNTLADRRQAMQATATLVLLLVITSALQVGHCCWSCPACGKALIACILHAGMSKNGNVVDAVVAISLAKLQGLCAQHHGSHQDACAHLEEGITACLKALDTDTQPGMQWLVHDLVASLRLAKADTYYCMVRPMLLQAALRTGLFTPMCFAQE